MAGKKTLGLLETGIEVRQPFHDRRPRHDDKARIGARPKHERLALADDARHVGLRSLRDSDWLTKCAKMVNGWLIIILPRDSGEGGPPCAAGWWKGRGPRRNLDNARLSADLELDESFVRFHRPATTTKLRVLRPLHHGSLAARAPVVPLPPLSRGRKEKRSRSRDACAPEVCQPKPPSFCLQKIRGGGAPKRRDCPVGPRHAADVAIHLRFGRRPRVQRNALAFRRSTAVLASAICRNSIQAALHTMQREGVTSTLASRLSEAPRAPVVMPAGSMPGPPGSGSD